MRYFLNNAKSMSNRFRLLLCVVTTINYEIYVKNEFVGSKINNKTKSKLLYREKRTGDFMSRGRLGKSGQVTLCQEDT